MFFKDLCFQFPVSVCFYCRLYQRSPVIKGFYVHTVPVTACGGYLSGTAGTFSYPNNPGHDEYDHDVNCAWVIHTLSNKVGCVCFSCDFVSVYLLWASKIPISILNNCLNETKMLALKLRTQLKFMRLHCVEGHDSCLCSQYGLQWTKKQKQEL